MGRCVRSRATMIRCAWAAGPGPAPSPLAHSQHPPGQKACLRALHSESQQHHSVQSRGEEHPACTASVCNTGRNSPRPDPLSNRCKRPAAAAPRQHGGCQGCGRSGTAVGHRSGATSALLTQAEAPSGTDAELLRLEELLRRPDFILERNVRDSVVQYIKSGGKPHVVLECLTEGYVGAGSHARPSSARLSFYQNACSRKHRREMTHGLRGFVPRRSCRGAVWLASKR